MKIKENKPAMSKLRRDEFDSRAFAKARAPPAPSSLTVKKKNERKKVGMMKNNEKETTETSTCK